MKFGILTGGGDCPGMNSFIRAVVRTALNSRPQTSVWGVTDGWKGLAEGQFRRLGKLDVAGISTAGGTIMGTLRFPELEHDVDLQETIARNVHDYGFDYMFILGGNGSLQASYVLDTIARREKLRTKYLFAPGSIDNDVCNLFGSSIGFYSAVDKSLQMLEWIRDTASSHRRVYLIGSMGRYAAYLPLFSGIVTGAEHVILPHEEVDYEKMATMIVDRNKDTRIIVSEAYEKSLDEIKAILQDIFTHRSVKREIRTVDMGYFQRGGKAAITDILRAGWLGFRMVNDAFESCDSGFYSAFYTGHKPDPVPLDVAADSATTNRNEVSPEIIKFANALL